jgi:hypothetical protein
LSYSSPIRIEIVTKDSTLPMLLAQYGYNPHHAESITRVTSNGIIAADVIEIDLPP